MWVNYFLGFFTIVSVLRVFFLFKRAGTDGEDIGKVAIEHMIGLICAWLGVLAIRGFFGV